MWILLLAIILSSLIVICFKLFTARNVDIHTAITTNYAVCVLTGLTLLKRGDLVQPYGNGVLLLSVLLGLSFVIVFHLYAGSAARAGVTITAVSGKMSVILPVLAGFFLFGERVDAIKAVAIAVALASFVLILWSHGSGIAWKFIAFPLLLFIGNGTNDTLLKLAEFSYITDAGMTVPFLLLLFTVAFLAGLLILIVRMIKRQSIIDTKSVVAGLILGLLNFGSTYYFLKGLDRFAVSIFVPSFNGGVVVLSALTGFLLFRERLTSLNWLGIVLATIAIVIIASPGNVVS